MNWQRREKNTSVYEGDGHTDGPLEKRCAVEIPRFAGERNAVEDGARVYERGGHGFDLVPKGTTSDHWFEELVWWMKSRGLMAPASDRPG